MKIKFIAVFTLIYILVTYNLAFAFESIDLPAGFQVPSQNININGDPYDGSFVDLSYIISSTGATSGIRYRTSAITITIGGYTATFDITKLGQAPTAGQSQYTQITISKADILSNFSGQEQNQINQLLQNPVDNVIIGANIQIYNAGTREVLATIKNRDDVASVAGNFGFGHQDISDMETRWQQAPGGSPPPPPEVVLPTGGLRPSVLVP